MRESVPLATLPAPVMEAFEARRLLSASLAPQTVWADVNHGASITLDSHFVLHVAAGSGNDTIIFSHDPVLARWRLSINNVRGRYSTHLLTGVSIDGGAGNDILNISDRLGVVHIPVTLSGGAGNDGLSAASHAAVLDGGSGNDQISGGDGNDTITTGDGTDTVFANAGDDSVTAGTGRDLIYGGDGNDTLVGGTNSDTIYGDAGDDLITGGTLGSELHGGDGNDTLQGRQGNDTLYGDAGNDFMQAGAGNDLLFGGDGNDLMYGDTGNDTLFGEAGNDSLAGNGEDRLLFEGVNGTGDNPTNLPAAELGNDSLDGGAGDDFLNCGTWSDDLHYDGQFDNPGQSTLTGGPGNDVLNTRGSSSLAPTDVITDQSAGDFVPVQSDRDDLTGVTDYAVHIHAVLNIYIDGQLVELPAMAGDFYGQLPNGHNTGPMIHVHETEANIIHYHDVNPHSFTLGDWFNAWGVSFDATHVGRYVVGNGHTLTMTVQVRGQGPTVPSTDFGAYVIQSTNIAGSTASDPAPNNMDVITLTYT